MRVLFIPAKAKIDAKELLKDFKIPFKKIGLCTTAQFLDSLKNIGAELERKGYEVKIGKPCWTAIKQGQILGCDVSAAKTIEHEVDCFLYIGTGSFHPIGISLQTEKPVFSLNPFTKKLVEIREEKTNLLKRKTQLLAKFKDAKRIGILVSIKPGQQNLQSDAVELKNLLQKIGKKAYLFICNDVLDSELQNFMHIDGWINTACPRLAEDKFSKPFINAFDFLASLAK
ncbi:MAG: diphthamide synthesis protein [Candidatus Nanoarchaeia archaeon]